MFFIGIKIVGILYPRTYYKHVRGANPFFVQFKVQN